MADEVKNVYYRAIADFSSLTGQLADLRKQMRDFGKEQDKQHTASKKRLQEETRFGRDRVAQAKSSKIAIDQVTKSLNDQRVALDRLMRSQANLGKTSNGTGAGYGGSSGEMNALSNAIKRYANSIGQLNTQLKSNVSLSRSSLTNVRESTKAYQGLGRSIDSLVTRMERLNKAQMNTNVVGRVTLNNQKNFVTALREATQASLDQSNALASSSVTSRAADSTSRALTETVKKTAREYRNKKKAVEDADSSVKKSLPTIQRTGSRWRDAQLGVEKFADAAKRVGSIRIGRDPTLFKMAGIIASILSMVNPLAAGLGGVGAAAFAVASNIASIGTAALTAIPGVLTLISVVSALKMAFGGVGSALSAGFKGSRGGGGGGGGASTPARIPRAELTAQEKLIRANETLRRAVEDVTFAQEDLNDARKDAKRRIDDLRKSVAAAAANELAAKADSQLAREAYANVMADPTSTLGDKMSAQANMMQADARIAEVLEENEQARKDLTKAEADGVDGARDVIMAQRRLTDSIDAVRDAELAIQNVHIDAANALNEVGAAGGAAGGGIDEFAEAMSKLSPSAQLFVRNVLAMKDAWNEVQQSVQENFFKQWAADVPRLTRTFPALQYSLGMVATELGKIAKASIDLVTSDKWIKDLYAMGDITAPVVRSLGEGAVYLLDAIMDLSIAAGPALQRLANGFADGAEKLRDLISAGRESGALSSAIDDAVTTMGQWWRIIKNTAIAVTNFGSAASDLGQWIVDGLEELTAGWAESSRRAMQDGSPFKTFLEDIKPLLTAVNDLVGDFFGWFATVARDPRNIQHMTDIVNVIKDDLGPALSRILNAFADTNIASDLVTVVADLVDILADFLEGGGAKALALLVGGLADLSSFLADTGLGAVLMGVAAGIAAIGFAVKGIRGLNSVMAMLNGGLPIVGSAGGRRGSGTTVWGGRPTGTVPRGSTSPRDQAGTSARSGRGGILGGLGRGAGRVGGALLGGLGMLAGLLPWGAGQDTDKPKPATNKPKPVTYTSPTKPAPVTYGTGSGGWNWNQGGSTGPQPDPAPTPKPKPKPAPKPKPKPKPAPKPARPLGAGGRAAGGLAGLAAMVLGGSVSGNIQNWSWENLTGEAGDSYQSGTWVDSLGLTQGTMRGMGNTATGAIDGAMTGAMIGSIIPGVGTLAGGLSGLAIGGIGGLLGTDSDDLSQLFDNQMGLKPIFDSIGGKFGNGANQIGDFFGGLGGKFQGGANQIGDFFGGIGSKFGNGASQIGDWWNGLWNTDSSNEAPGAGGSAMDLTSIVKDWFGENPFEGAGKWIEDSFTNIGDGFASAGQWVVDAVNNVGTWFSDAGLWVQEKINEIGQWFSDAGVWVRDKINEIGQWFSDAGVKVRDIIGRIGQWFSDAGTRVRDALGRVGQWFSDAGTRVRDIFNNVGSWISGAGNTVRGVFNNIGSWIGGAGNSVRGALSTVGSWIGSAGDWVRGRLYAVGEWVQSAGSWISGRMNDVGSAISGAASWIRSLFGGGSGNGKNRGSASKNSGGRVLRRAAGGDVPLVPGNGNGDTVSALLTPGEFVVRKQVVSQVGPENLARLNSGVMSFADMLQQVVAEGNSASNGNTKLRFSTGGIVGLAGKYSGGNARVSKVIGLSQSSVAKKSGSTPVASGNATPKPSTPTETVPAPVDTSDKITIENFNVTNPVPEPASDTLPKQVRKLGYKGR